jgi:DDE superfamily endonuclease
VGASPRFPPRHAETARAAVLDVVRRAPRCFGIDRTRWTLRDVGATVEWLNARTPSAIWRTLDRLEIGLKRGRDHVHSPDPAYAAKQAAIAASLAEARASDGRVVALFQDEVTLHRQPSRAPDWARRGRAQPLARRSRRADAPVARIVGVLDAGDGRVLVRRRATLTVPALVGFYQDVAAAYPDAARIDIILDNWPVHFHPDLLVALQPQACPFPFPRPPSWPSAPSAAAVRKWSGLNLPIRLVPLPTYASWLNPIEKLWRWLRQDVVHLHPWADAIPTLRETVDGFLGQFRTSSAATAALLRYAGLEHHD